MTKFITLGNDPKVQLKPTKFRWVLENDLSFSSASKEPGDYGVVELVCKSYGSTGFDLILAHNGTRLNCVFYLGHWNDGIEGGDQ